MIPRFNLHTHTKYCDGADTPEDTVKSAISLGCDGIGFSGHSYLPFACGWCMTPADTEKYRVEIKALRKKYAGIIEIPIGLEYDYYSVVNSADYDYIIGSVHYVKKSGKYIPVDEAKTLLVSDVNTYYDGDFYAFCCEYYKNVADVYNNTKCDIVGHFDLVTKYNDYGVLFDETDPKYRRAALDAADALIAENVIFEINTGAMSRGYKKTPYPSEFILKYLAGKDAKITVTTDSHKKDTILYYYNEAIEYAGRCGVKQLYFMKNGKFEPFEI